MKNSLSCQIPVGRAHIIAGTIGEFLIIARISVVIQINAQKARPAESDVDS